MMNPPTKTLTCLKKIAFDESVNANIFGDSMLIPFHGFMDSFKLLNGLLPCQGRSDLQPELFYLTFCLLELRLKCSIFVHDSRQRFGHLLLKISNLKLQSRLGFLIFFR